MNPTDTKGVDVSLRLVRMPDKTYRLWVDTAEHGNVFRGYDIPPDGLHLDGLRLEQPEDGDPC